MRRENIRDLRDIFPGALWVGWRRCKEFRLSMPNPNLLLIMEAQRESPKPFYKKRNILFEYATYFETPFVFWLWHYSNRFIRWCVNSAFPFHKKCFWWFNLLGYHLRCLENGEIVDWEVWKSCLNEGDSDLEREMISFPTCQSSSTSIYNPEPKLSRSGVTTERDTYIINRKGANLTFRSLRNVLILIKIRVS